MRLLVIENSPVCRRQLSRLLEDRGHVVLTEATLAGGIRLARSQRPDLILLRASSGGNNGRRGNQAAGAFCAAAAAVAQLKTHPRTASTLVLALIDAALPSCPPPRRLFSARAAKNARVPSVAQAAMDASDRMLAAGCDGRIVFPSEPGAFLAKVERFLKRVPPSRHPDDLMPIMPQPDPLPPLPNPENLRLPETQPRPILLPGEECLLMGAVPATDAGDELLLPLRR